MRVNYNVSAMIAQNALATNDAKFTASTGRLSSGKKINNAKDNPSGLAMSRRMNAQIKGMQEANKSTNNAINVIKTADGVLGEIHDILQRMNELADRAATGTLQDVDREYIQDEISQLKSEIQRISDSTEFNGQKLLDGTFDKKVYTLTDGATDSAVKTIGFENIENEKITITGLTTQLRNIGKRDDALDDGAKELDPGYNIPVPSIKDSVTGANVFKGNVKVETQGDLVKFYDETGSSITMQIDKALSGEAITIDIPDNGDFYAKDRYGMATQIGSNEGQYLNIVIPDVSIYSMGIRFTDMSTQEWAREAIDDIKGALDYVSHIRSGLGAYQNRLEHTASNLDVNEENMTAAYSRIMDTDMAEEMTEYSTLQVVTQAGISMLAQANQRPADLLQLLQ